jgi:hypothetical protein
MGDGRLFGDTLTFDDILCANCMWFIGWIPSTVDSPSYRNGSPYSNLENCACGERRPIFCRDVSNNPALACLFFEVHGHELNLSGEDDPETYHVAMPPEAYA